MYVPLFVIMLLIMSCQTFEAPVTHQKIGDLGRYDKASAIIYTEYVDPVTAEELMDWSIDGIRKRDRSSHVTEEDHGSLPEENLFLDSLETPQNLESVQSHFKSLHNRGSQILANFSSHDFINAAISGMIEHLDPQCAFLAPEKLHHVKTSSQGQFTGIGAVITMKDDAVTVLFPIKGTPAHKAGILPGDRLYRINGAKVHTVRDARNKSHGSDGKKLTLTILRNGSDTPIECQIVRDVISNKSVHVQNLGSDSVTPGSEALMKIQQRILKKDWPA